MIEWIEGAGKVRCTEALELDDLPKGTVSRLLVEIARDALGAPIWAPVLVARGEKPGPVFGMTSALHGNELMVCPLSIVDQRFAAARASWNSRRGRDRERPELSSRAATIS